MTFASEFLPTVPIFRFTPLGLLANWLRRRRAQRRHIEALRDLVESPDWLLDDIGLSREDLRSRLDAAERGDARHATGSDTSRRTRNRKGYG